jgi:hypothetical protein
MFVDATAEMLTSCCQLLLLLCTIVVVQQEQVVREAQAKCEQLAIARTP